MRRIRFVALVFVSMLVLYLLAWPVPVEPVAWTAPSNRYTGPFLRNERLTDIETLSLGGDVGPEDVAVDADGRIYFTDAWTKLGAASAGDTWSRPLKVYGCLRSPGSRCSDT